MIHVYGNGSVRGVRRLLLECQRHGFDVAILFVVSSQTYMAVEKDTARHLYLRRETGPGGVISATLRPELFSRTLARKCLMRAKMLLADVSRPPKVFRLTAGAREKPEAVAS